MRVYLGCYGPSIYKATLDDAGELAEPTAAGEIKNASFLAKHPTLPVLYCCTEAGPDGGVAAFDIGHTTGDLVSHGEPKPTGGGGTCFVAVTPDGRWLLAANYGGGSVAAFHLDARGHIGDRGFFHQHEGSGPNERRQQKPHAHCFRPDPTGRFALSCNLGNDTIYVYRTGETVEEAGTFKLPAGAGPRHLAFTPDAKHLYVLGELDNRLYAFAWNDGTAEPIGDVPTLPDHFDGQSTTAEVVVDAQGRTVYASNRGHDSIAVFARHAATGKLTPRGHARSGGEQPRHFALTLDGRRMIVANQNTGTVATFDVCEESGELTPTGAEAATVEKPVCVLPA